MLNPPPCTNTTRGVGPQPGRRCGRYRSSDCIRAATPRSWAYRRSRCTTVPFVVHVEAADAAGAGAPLTATPRATPEATVRRLRMVEIVRRAREVRVPPV